MEALTTHWERAGETLPEGVASDVVLELGWGRIAFGQTFTSHDRLRAVLRGEESGRRDICVYPREPHVLVAQAPSELFLDPSHVYRLDLPSYAPHAARCHCRVRPLRDRADVEAVNAVYATAGMLHAAPELVLCNAEDPVFTYLVAEDPAGRVVGSVTGIDHVRAFGDPEGGTSLWCLAVDPQSRVGGVGEALTRALADVYRERGRAYIDLSVLHDNRRAIRLYERIGFTRVPVLSVKRKNGINEPLFVGPASPDYRRLNPYARIIADAARRRGIDVEVRDAEWGELRLSHGGRSISTRESLSELTTAVAMSRCDDKRITRRVLEAAGLRVPRGRTATTPEQDATFLGEVGEVVVKPARGEQGRGITVGVRDPQALVKAVEEARRHCPDVLMEELCQGEDLRVLVIDHQVVAAAVRIPATVLGDGVSTVRQLVQAHSRRREAATGGESRIPMDDGTADTVRAAGLDLDDVLPEGVELRVRRTANLHTGGTIHDVTADLHPDLAAACTRASRALDIPVTGLDLLVPDVSGTAHVFIEANERPGLANHEPQPVADRFVDLLFPATA
ncbi:MAG: GNAT-family acetyltransferase [Frankiales bacterium]|jgi:GNAT-family acetyltransferase (TIGR03103 family)|nr:GNAT-family acetyltransferase [Frankiales bacterium]